MPEIENRPREKRRCEEDAGKQAAAYQRELNADYDEETLAKWEADGTMQVHILTDEEMVAFKEPSDPVYQQYAELLMNDKGMSADEVETFLAAFGVEVDL